MNNIHLSILGSAPFSNILNEIEFNNILNRNNISDHNDKKILVKILFAENLKIKEVKSYLSKNEPIILFLNNKDYIKKNTLIILYFPFGVIQSPSIFFFPTPAFPKAHLNLKSLYFR